jgi:predicted amidohydrolase YtcJ
MLNRGSPRSFHPTLKMSIPATLILRNAKVWTGDEQQPAAQAVAVIGDEVVRVGTDREIDALRGTGTVVRDLGGKLVLPGFNDSHVFVDAGRNLLSVKLRDAASPEELARRSASSRGISPRANGQ